MSARSKFIRFFNILVMLALFVMAAFTIQQTAIGALVAEAAGALSANPAAGTAQCLQMEPRQSITATFVKDLKMWVAHTEDGPTGVDGGLIYLLSLPRCK